MESLLLLSKDQTKLQAYLKQFCLDHAISQFDQTLVSEEGSIGVEIIRKLQEKIFLKPFQSKEKVIIFEKAQNLTIEAQNALLKILEEPPAHTYIILCAFQEDILLPTILSRCHIIHLEEKRKDMSLSDKEFYEKDLTILLSGTIGEKLQLVETVAKDKQEAFWLEQIIHVARNQMLDNEEKQLFLPVLKHLQQAHKEITTTNVSARVILEHYFLTL